MCEQGDRIAALEARNAALEAERAERTTREVASQRLLVEVREHVARLMERMSGANQRMDKFAEIFDEHTHEET